ncbi:MAG: hypothetical protein IKH75_00960 [Ruminococcus sp.]|nr:hypothetical protein [Ruminococcus sp.]
MKAVFVGGWLNGVEVDEAHLDELYGNGKKTMDWSAERAAANGRGCFPSPLLDNRPMVDGYLSPMLDGGKLRYETQEVYDMLSR